jgi:hypothetical protein
MIRLQNHADAADSSRRSSPGSTTRPSAWSIGLTCRERGDLLAQSNSVV